MRKKLGLQGHAGLLASAASQEFRRVRRLVPAVAVEERTSARRLVGGSQSNQSVGTGKAAQLRLLPISAAENGWDERGKK